MDKNEEWLLGEIEKVPYLVKELDGLKELINRLKADSKVRPVFGQKRKMAYCIEKNSEFLELFPQEKKVLEYLLREARGAVTFHLGRKIRKQLVS